jgi:hypothetical protein
MNKQTLNMRSLLYKLVDSKGVIVAEGNKKNMQRMLKGKNGHFVGIGAPYSTLGQIWGKTS